MNHVMAVVLVGIDNVGGRKKPKRKMACANIPGRHGLDEGLDRDASSMWVLIAEEILMASFLESWKVGEKVVVVAVFVVARDLEATNP